jgi:ADP-heptose:LPS heptosyltransferase
MLGPIEEITVIRAGALGDVVLALPAVAALRSALPRARLRAVGYPANWAVAGALIDDVWSIDAAAMAGLLTNVPGESLQKALASSDLVVAWTGHDPTSGLQTIGVRRIVHAPPTPPPGVHAARWLLQSLSQVMAEESGLPVSAIDPQAWQLPYTGAELLEGRALLEEVRLAGAILMHPGAGAAWKRWPADRFASTGLALIRRGLTVALVEGPADGEAVAAVQDHAGRPFPVLPPMEPRALGAILAQTPCYVGNDSGVTHLAGASGAPTVALFGPTDPATWGPLGKTTVLRHCAAGGRPATGIRICDDPECLQAIAVDEVVRALERITVQKHVENRGQTR